MPNATETPEATKAPELTYPSVIEYAKRIGFATDFGMYPYVNGENLTLKRLDYRKLDEFLAWVKENESFPSGISIHPGLHWMRLKLNDKVLPAPYFEEQIESSIFV